MIPDEHQSSVKDGPMGRADQSTSPTPQSLASVNHAQTAQAFLGREVVAACIVLMLSPFWAAAQWQCERLKSFGYPDGSSSRPQARLIKDSNGSIYGTSQYGGVTGDGTVFVFPATTGQLLVLHSFSEDIDGAYPRAGVVKAPDGALYGTTSRGGQYGGGTAFRVGRDGSRFTVLHHFGSGSDGATPEAELLVSSDGSLYGTTASGGALTKGTVFRLSTDGRYRILHDFTDWESEGRSPYAGLIEDGDGLLYGAASAGGTNGCGTLFRLLKDGSQFTVLHTLDSIDGAWPKGDLCLGSDGRLYGTTSHGGTSWVGGTVFALDRNGKEFRVLHTFGLDLAEGQSPVAGVSEGSDGRLYGSTYSGGRSNQGTIFALTKSGDRFEILRDLNPNAGEGGLPMSGLLADGQGLLYGTCAEGEGYDGTLFRLQEDGDRFTVLWSFTYSGGDCLGPFANVIEGNDGVLYGTCKDGGFWNQGAVFRVHKNGSGYTMLRSFSLGSDDGAVPAAPLLEDSEGVLYGTTTYGGQGQGTVFRMAKDGSEFTLVHSFAASGAEGANPSTPLLEGIDGFLYGAAMGGGISNRGVLFRVDKKGNDFSLLHQFTGGTNDGAWPTAGLAQDTGGMLYGCTISGGTSNGGTLFKVETNGAHFQILRHFAALGTDGREPWATLLLMRHTLFGTTRYGGSGDVGTLFSINTDGSEYLRLHDFQTSQGAFPSYPALTEGPDGALYGTTSTGGSFDGGTIFRIGRDGSGFAVMHHFIPGTGGYITLAGLLLGSDGLWYGTTQEGGEMNEGTVYRLRLVPPRISAVTRSNNCCRLTVSGKADCAYELQATDNLVPASWTALGTNAANTNGIAVLDDSTAPAPARRSYRVRWLP